MVTRRRFLILAGSAGAVGVAIVAVPALLEGEDLDPDREPVVRYGEEACARCGMIIDDARFAAAWTTESGEVHFDDIGCLVLEAAERPAPGDARHWVNTYVEEAWAPVETATFVLSAEIRSPMAFGAAAAPDRDASDRLAQEMGGTVVAWHALTEHIHEHGPYREPSHGPEGGGHATEQEHR
ncbi:MAG: nitrous oxide reductase accessory protein NosL [Dehalococcoidia bacterium]|nr:nitrous oxide reductase accessory protein NosL [Dehalococcoidia bacterium]